MTLKIVRCTHSIGEQVCIRCRLINEREATAAVRLATANMQSALLGEAN